MATDNRGRTFQFVSWLLFTVALFAVCTRLATKYAILRQLSRDDWIILSALVIFLAQSVGLTAAASNGLGQTTAELTTESLGAIMKTTYASVHFLIVALALVKLSIFKSIHELTPQERNRQINMVLGVFTGLWFVPALLVSIFQCELPSPWDFSDSTRCVDRGAWWSFVAVGNMVTEFGIVALYTIIMMRLQASSSRKGIILTVFSMRILVIVAAAAQLAVFLGSASDHDIASGLSLPTVLNQLVVCVSITTACLPYLRPFMESLDSDILRVEDNSGSEEHVPGNFTGFTSYNLSRIGFPTTSSSRAEACQHRL